MIVHMTGTVAEVREDGAVIERDGLGYEVLLCGYALGEIAACRGQQVTLHTLEYYESGSAGGNLVPRIVGFLHPEDRRFFTRFITVKGMGVRRAIKALAEPIARVAAAIEAGDDAALGRLPGVGKRMSQQIIAELKGKVAEFALGAAEPGEAPVEPGRDWSADLYDALAVLMVLGERRAEAQRWLERARQLHPDTTGCDEWVKLAYRVRGLSAGQ